MAPETKHRKKAKTTLFARIMFGLTFPLLFLSVAFTAIQLRNEMRTIRESYQIRSRFAFETVNRTLEITLRDPEVSQNRDTVLMLMQQLENAHEGITICLYSLLERGLIPESCSAWSGFDEKSTEASLYQKQQGKPYLVKVQKTQRKLIAYIPLNNSEGDPGWIVRVEFPLGNVKEALANSRWTLIMMILMIIFTGFAIGYRLSESIVKPMITLDEATREILKGHLGKHVHIETGDEIEALATTFNQMSDSLKEMKQKAQDSNPLTGLPGNQGIFQALKKKIHERQKFVLFHTDLDRFKVFNDHFGLAKGDEAIKKTADLLRKALKEKGGEEDFIGHQGGDDFVIITRPSRAVEMGEFITKQFETDVVAALYPKEDIERGYTLQMDRRRLAETGEEVMAQFPLLAISLAGVSTAKKDFADYFDCMSAAVSVKKEVKKIIQSSYMIKE